VAMALPMLRPTETLGRWDPLQEFHDLNERLNTLMSSLFGPIEGPGAMMWKPLADVTETADSWLVEIDVPGVKQEDIDIEVASNELIVTGECKERAHEGTPRTRMRRSGRFEYRTTLPPQVNTENITADLTDGVLSIRIPKSETVKTRHIPIGRG